MLDTAHGVQGCEPKRVPGLEESCCLRWETGINPDSHADIEIALPFDAPEGRLTVIANICVWFSFVDPVQGLTRNCNA